MPRYTPLFVSGPARSGSTLLAHMLNAHPSIAMASDAFFPLFRAWRNAVIRQSGESFADWSAAAPLEDYYFSRERLRRLDLIQASELTEGAAPGERSELAGTLEQRARHESPDIAPRLARLEGETYRELFASGLQIVAETRPRLPGGWAGSKDVWSIEFLRPLARAFPHARFIVLLRDPRAMVASMLAIARQDASQVAHTLSYARHWRKCAAFGLAYRRDDSLACRVHLLLYEELVQNPGREAQRLCEFLDVPFHAGMIDVGQFRTSSEASPWQGNSSFQDRLPEISRDYAERWRTQLPSAVRRLVEFVCGPEMRAFGYPAEDRPGADPEVLAYLLENNRQYCSWRSDFGDVQRDWGYELFRRALLGQPGALESELVRRSFLFEEVYSCLRTS